MIVGERTAGWGASGARLLGVAPYLALLYNVYLTFALTADDPYITFRYAANLNAGHGPVFNIGERVEGFSSPLHLLLCAVLLKVAPGVDILFKAKLAGVLFGLVILYQTRLFALAAGLGVFEATMAQSLVALNVNFGIAAVNGLETTLYGALLLAVALTFLREVKTRTGTRSALWLFLCLTARPDAIVLYLTLSVLQVINLEKGIVDVQRLARWGALAVLPAALLFVSRFSYYGSWLPNTYYAKHVDVVAGLRAGLSDLSDGVSTHLSGLHTALTQPSPFSVANPIALGLFWLFFALGLVYTRREQPAAFAVCAACIAAVFLFILRSGGDWMIGWRFAVPALPFLAVLQCFGMRLVTRAPIMASPPALGVAVAATWAVVMQFSPHYTWSSVRLTTNGGTMLGQYPALGKVWVGVGEYLRDQVPVHASVAYSELGYAGYRNMDKSFIDVRGLTDRTIAGLPGVRHGAPGVQDPSWYLSGDPLNGYLRAKKPDVIVEVNAGPKDIQSLGIYSHRTLTLAAANGTPITIYIREGGKAAPSG